MLCTLAAIRVPFALEPGASSTIDSVTGVVPTREALNYEQPQVSDEVRVCTKTACAIRTDCA